MAKPRRGGNGPAKTSAWQWPAAPFGDCWRTRKNQSRAAGYGWIIRAPDVPRVSRVAATRIVRRRRRARCGTGLVALRPLDGLRKARGRRFQTSAAGFQFPAAGGGSNWATWLPMAEAPATCETVRWIPAAPPRSYAVSARQQQRFRTAFSNSDISAGATPPESGLLQVEDGAPRSLPNH